MKRSPLSAAVMALALAMPASGCGGTSAGAPANSGNPLIGSWKVADGASCPYLGVTFVSDEMVVHFAATMTSAAYDSKTQVEYEVRPGEVIIHDPAFAANAPAYEFDNENQIRLGGSEGCVFRRV